ncbi:unnamed protein product [Penicillium glandicola]
MIDLHEDESLKWTEEDIRTIVKETCLLKQGEKEFCEILTKRANGTFLWIALAVSLLDDRLAQRKIVDGDLAFLDKLLPIGLDAMYNNMLSNILECVHRKSQSKEMMEIFRCLAASLHPLTKGEVAAITAIDDLVVNDALEAFQHVLSVTGKGTANEAVELIHSSLKDLLVQDSASLVPEEICWLVWPALHSTGRWLHENCFQLWLYDYVVSTTLFTFVYFQGPLYQHRILVFGFLFCLLQFASRARRSSLLIGLFYKVFELWINKTTMIIFCVCEKEVHRFMFERCIVLMDDRDKGLKRGMCGAGHPGPLESKTKAEEQCHILRYPSRYWVRHLERSYIKSYEIDKVYAFLNQHFLHWLEAMSIFGVIPEAAGELKIVQGIIQHEAAMEVSEFLYDAWRFALRTRHIAETAPLQLYYSGLVFALMQSIIRERFRAEIHRLCKLPKVEEFWSAELQTLEGHSSAITPVTFSPDGQVASGSGDKTIRLWNGITGKEQHVLEGHASLVTLVACSPNGQIASGSLDKTIRLWDPTTGKERHILKGHSGPVTSLAFSPDGQILASGSEDKTIILWDAITGKERHIIKEYCDLVTSVTFSPNGQILALGLGDTTIRLWDTMAGKERQILKGHSGWISSVVFSPNGQIASGSFDQTVRLWDVITGKERQVLRSHSGWIRSVAFSPNGQVLASGSFDQTVRLWDAMTGQERQVLEGHSGRVTSVAFSPNGQTLASGSDDKTGQSSWITSVAFSPNGEERQVLKGHSGGIRSVAFSPNDQTLLASSSDDGTIRLWDAITGKEKHVLEGHSGWIRSMAFSPDGQTILALGSFDRAIRLWDTITGKERHIIEGHSDLIRAVAFSSDGQTLASGSNDKTIRLWDAITGKEQQVLVHDSGLIRSVAFSSDGQTLSAFSSDDGTIRLWDVRTGKEQKTSEDQSETICEGNDQISLRNDFIAFRGEDILWLPMEYRGYSCSVFYKGSLAFGYRDGRVLIVGFNKCME